MAHKICDKGCEGKGLVARERRKMENGEPDPADFRRYELCPGCNGSGVVTDWGGKPVPAAWRESGFAADHISGLAFWNRAQHGSFS